MYRERSYDERTHDHSHDLFLATYLVAPQSPKLPLPAQPATTTTGADPLTAVLFGADFQRDLVPFIASDPEPRAAFAHLKDPAAAPYFLVSVRGERTRRGTRKLKALYRYTLDVYLRADVASRDLRCAEPGVYRAVRRLLRSHRPIPSRAALSNGTFAALPPQSISHWKPTWCPPPLDSKNTRPTLALWLVHLENDPCAGGTSLAPPLVRLGPGGVLYNLDLGEWAETDQPLRVVDISGMTQYLAASWDDIVNADLVFVSMGAVLGAAEYWARVASLVGHPESGPDEYHGPAPFLGPIDHDAGRAAISPARHEFALRLAEHTAALIASGPAAYGLTRGEVVFERVQFHRIFLAVVQEQLEQLKDLRPSVLLHQILAGLRGAFKYEVVSPTYFGTTAAYTVPSMIDRLSAAGLRTLLSHLPLGPLPHLRGDADWIGFVQHAIRAVPEGTLTASLPFDMKYHVGAVAPLASEILGAHASAASARANFVAASRGFTSPPRGYALRQLIGGLQHRDHDHQLAAADSVDPAAAATAAVPAADHAPTPKPAVKQQPGHNPRRRGRPPKLSPARSKGTTTSASPARSKGTTTSASPARSKGTTTSASSARSKGTTTSAAPASSKGLTTSVSSARSAGSAATHDVVSSSSTDSATRDVVSSSDGTDDTHPTSSVVPLSVPGVTAARYGSKLAAVLTYILHHHHSSSTSSSPATATRMVVWTQFPRFAALLVAALAEHGIRGVNGTVAPGSSPATDAAVTVAVSKAACLEFERIAVAPAAGSEAAHGDGGNNDAATTTAAPAAAVICLDPETYLLHCSFATTAATTAPDPAAITVNHVLFAHPLLAETDGAAHDLEMRVLGAVPRVHDPVVPIAPTGILSPAPDPPGPHDVAAVVPGAPISTVRGTVHVVRFAATGTIEAALTEQRTRALWK
ncbi:hypothetical protein H9P43_002960 [Blastocladiella emersonii ATCC 22665]|nr:hypothetical protein H9P43_002960 [Blastocladiella emersonii ATCC 22665]